MSQQPDRQQPASKPSIYPAPETEVTLVETHSALERQIASIRHAITTSLGGVRARVQGIVDRWVDVEHAIERRAKSIITPQEPLTPGVLYVGVATLTGSVITRNRSYLLRFTLPPALLLFTMNHFLPQTSHNLSAYLSSLERAHAPAVADAHASVSQHITSTSAAAQEAWYRARERTRFGVAQGLGVLQDVTGLKLHETLGRDRPVNVKTETSAATNDTEVDGKINK